MTVTVAVAGASGYAGGELLRLLLTHPEVKIGALTAATSAGTKLGEHHPHLPPLADRLLDKTTVEVLVDHDVVFLALPHGHSADIASQLGDSALVVDLAADHRLRNPSDWQRWYGGAYAEAWPYGLPELPGIREKLRGARRIAVPGCFPTGGTLAMAPALQANLVEAAVSVVSVTGASGAGKSTSPRLLGSEVMGSVSAYGVGGLHRHTPEFAQNFTELAGKPVSVSFTPVLAPLSRGILTTASADLRSGVDEVMIRAAYQEMYADEMFVQLLPEGQWPSTAATVGANNVQLQVAVDTNAGRLIAVTALDNLTKGTAGGAIQAMNLALGFAEETGLTTVGVAP